MATQPPGGPPIRINVWAWRDATNNSICFDHEWQVQGNPTASKGRIDVPNGQPPTDFDFHLIRDDTGLELKFCTPKEEAMYVGPAPNCPPPKGNGGQFTYKQVSNNHLKVEDANSVAGDLKYALRFDGNPNPSGPPGQQNPPYLYDPDIRNGGGGGILVSKALATAVGAVVGAAAALVFVEAASAPNIVIGALIGAILGFVLSQFLGGTRQST